jgi:pyrroline-5-carboxylate reductase
MYSRWMVAKLRAGWPVGDDAPFASAAGCRTKDRMKATVFLGGGRITGAMVAGLRLAGYARPFVVYDRHPERLRALRRESQVEIESDLRVAVQRAEMLIVAVGPAAVAGMLGEVAGCGAAIPKVCVSLAAGIPLQKLRAALGSPARWARAMPSPVSRVGRGLTALCFDRSASANDRRRVRQLFRQVGTVLEIPERQFDAFTAVYSSSFAYHALETLAAAADEAGLDRQIALLAAAHGLSDGIAYWRTSGRTLSDLLKEAVTPGGIAAATIAAMDEAGFRTAVARGVKAGIGQARRNAKQ